MLSGLGLTSLQLSPGRFAISPFQAVNHSPSQLVYATMTDGTATPITSKVSNLAMTEYATAPTPPSERTEQQALGLPPDWGIPDTFLLPNGYPDVRPNLSAHCF